MNIDYEVEESFENVSGDENEDESEDESGDESREDDDEEELFDLGNFTYFNDLEKRFLIRNNYIFKWYRKNKGSGSEYWLCKRCLKHSVTVENNLITNENSHLNNQDDEDTCIHTDEELLCLKTVVRIRERCYKEVNPIPEIYDDEIATLNEFLSTDVISRYISPFQTMRTTLYNIRKKKLPSIPNHTSEIALTEEFAQTIDKKRFILYDSNDDDRVIAFCSDAGLEKLAASDKWHIDGTFKAAPLMYYQLLIIHSYLFGVMFP